MKKLIVLICVILAGCWQSVNTYDIVDAIKVCAEKDTTIVEISAMYDGKEFVTCSNGRKFELHSN